MKKVSLPLLVCLALALPALSQEIVYGESLGAIDFRDLEGCVFPQPPPHEVEHESRREWPIAQQSLIEASLAWETPAQTTAARPPITTSFESIGSANLSPCDVSGAAGRQHVVTATNAGVIVHTRSGTASPSVPLPAFLSDLFGDTGIYTDPRIAYDAGNDRWIVFGLRYPTWALICVSQTNDPRGAWTRYRLTIDNQVGNIDFTRLALTRDTIVAVTYDDLYSYAFSIRKSDLYALPPSLPTTFRRLDEWNAVPVTGEESPVEYVLLDDYSQDLFVARLDQIGSSIKRVSGAFPWNRGTVLAPQLGGGRIDTGFFDIESAVLRDGRIYAVNTTRLSSPTRTSIIWWELEAETGLRLAGGMIDDPAGGKYYAYPSIAVNRGGAALIGFATFSATQYPSAGYVYIDAQGAVSSEGLLKAGTSSSSSARWGDYTTTMVDPLDDFSFWTVQQASADGHWVSWWGRIASKTKARAVRH